MAIKKVTQLRFFGDNNSYLNTSDKNAIYHQMDENQPNSLSSVDLSSGDAFNLNANLDPIIIGQSGMYELDLTNSSAILTSLTFEKDSLDQIDKNPDGYLIIDIVYKED